MTIIASTDFSEIAENSVQYAAAIAKLTGSELVLYHGYKLPLHASNTILPAESFQGMLEKDFNRLKAQADLLSEEYGINVIPECSFANIDDYLEFLIDKYDAKLLVLGMAAKSLEQDLMGNMTTSVIKNITIPVFAVPGGVRFNGVSKILFACDSPKDVPAAILEKIKDTAQNLGAEVEIFSVDEEIRQLNELNSSAVIDAHLTGINYYYKNVRSNAVVEAIKKEILETGAEMLIMMPKQYGFWTSLVHRSKTRMMASGLNIPLLSLPLYQE